MRALPGGATQQAHAALPAPSQTSLSPISLPRELLRLFVEGVWADLDEEVRSGKLVPTLAEPQPQSAEPQQPAEPPQRPAGAAAAAAAAAGQEEEEVSEDTPLSDMSEDEGEGGGAGKVRAASGIGGAAAQPKRDPRKRAWGSLGAGPAGAGAAPVKAEQPGQVAARLNGPAPVVAPAAAAPIPAAAARGSADMYRMIAGAPPEAAPQEPNQPPQTRPVLPPAPHAPPPAPRQQQQQAQQAQAQAQQQQQQQQQWQQVPLMGVEEAAQMLANAGPELLTALMQQGV